MKTPTQISKVTLVKEFSGEGPYPPKGFLPFAEHELGNGDSFGMYWPLGNESEEPIVCELWHDSWQLNPAFSSLARFLDHAEDEDESEHVEDPTLTEDDRSPVALTTAATNEAKHGEIETAISHLQTAVDVLPEYRTAWGALAQQYRRVKRFDEALKAVLNALVAPSFFGVVNPNLVTWFQRQDSEDLTLTTDPLWQRRKDLCFSYGGSKENEDYPILLQCIDEYEQMGNGNRAILLLQQYSLQMTLETVSFQERNGFSDSWFSGMQERLFTQHLNSTRNWTSRG